ncbi:hypothetical protein EU538_04855 [Candidatus Thorarchaeota archaeon]|nr:MAG: hypothetical protein EU538_04855 [Candidatus Thorarchaeota archaeon]
MVHLRYEGRETIKLPEGKDSEDVRSSIREWMKTSKGREYRVEDWYSDRFVLWRSWRQSPCFTTCLIGFWWTAWAKDRIKITVRVEATKVYLQLGSSVKQEAERDFDSLIDKIEEGLSK